MADRTYSLAEVQQGIRAIVAEVGSDFTYVPIKVDGRHTESCYYIHPEDKPGCLIGRYLASIGASPSVLHECNGQGSVPYIWATLKSYGFFFTDDAEAWMRTVQQVQDRGRPWGEALTEADAALERINA